LGVSDNDKTRNVLRFYGARELAAGFGILSQSNPSVCFGRGSPETTTIAAKALLPRRHWRNEVAAAAFYPDRCSAGWGLFAMTRRRSMAWYGGFD